MKMSALRSNELITTPERSSEDSASVYNLEKEISQFLEGEENRSSPAFAVYPGIEAVEYDFAGERQNPHATNLIESTAHLIKGCLGAGVLGMHEAFMHGGIWTSLAATLVIGVMVPYIMLMLVSSAQTMYLKIRVPRLSYPDLVEAAVATGPVKKLRRFSKTIRYTVDTCLFIELCGSCCIFEIMIARTLKQVLESLSPQIGELNLGLRIYIVIITAPLILICMIRSLKYLAPFSLLADIFVAICVSGTILYTISSAKDLSERPAWKGVHGLFQFLGTCLYSIQGITIALPVENNMRDPKYFTTVLQFGMTMVVTFVAAVGFFGYWGAGEECQTPVTMHLPLKSAADFLQLLIAFMLAITFAVHFWVPFRIIWHYVGKRHRRKRFIFERIYRALHVILISCVSIAYPKANSIMTLLGAVFCGFAGFVFPALAETLVMWREDRRNHIRWRFVKNILLMILGGVLCCGSIYSFLVT